jgi:hypothetical protein
VLQLTLAIFVHAVLGVLLAALVWAAGYGLVAAARRAGLDLGPARVVAYPAGLLLTLLVCACVLVTPWLGLIPGLVLAISLWHALRTRPAIAHRAAELVAWALPAAIGPGVVLGFFLHGPTDRVDSNAFGDVVWYAAKVASAKESLFPFRDLAAAGVHLWRSEIGPTLIGAVVTRLPVTDPFLFHTTLLPTFALVSLCIGFSQLRPRASSTWTERTALALLAAAAVAYPSWLAESPPVTLALPLGFSIYALMREGLAPKVFATGVTLVALDLALTKALVLVPFAILASFAAHERYRPMARSSLAMMAAGVSAALGLIAWTLANSFWILHEVHLRVTPLPAFRGLRSQLDTRSTTQLAPALALAGYLLLAVLLVRGRNRPREAPWRFDAATRSRARGPRASAQRRSLRRRGCRPDSRSGCPRVHPETETVASRVASTADLA